MGNQLSRKHTIIHSHDNIRAHAHHTVIQQNVVQQNTTHHNIAMQPTPPPLSNSIRAPKPAKATDPHLHINRKNVSNQTS